MVRTLQIALVLVLVLGLGSAVLAQQPQEAQAPVPVQITTAKRIFISNGGGDSSIPAVFSFGRDYLYNEFYSAMKNWGRVELVQTPAEADVVLEVALSFKATGGRVIKGDTVGPGYDTQLKLTVLDPKTHITLWAFVDHVEPAILQGNRDKNLKIAVAKVVEEAKAILTHDAPAGGPK